MKPLTSRIGIHDEILIALLVIDAEVSLSAAHINMRSKTVSDHPVTVGFVDEPISGQGLAKEYLRTDINPLEEPKAPVYLRIKTLKYHFP